MGAVLRQNYDAASHSIQKSLEEFTFLAQSHLWTLI